MAENFFVKEGTKEEKYKSLIPQLTALLQGEEDLIANLSNTVSVLKMGMGFFWVGFYLVKENELVLGPFQGSVACTRIQKGRGVCGASWDKAQTIIVEDVEKFPGHIACSSLSKSEIVLPIFNNSGDVLAVLDVDEDKLSAFDHTDEIYLTQVCKLVAPYFEYAHN